MTAAASTYETVDSSAASAAVRAERVAVAAFVTSSLLAGGNAVGIRISLREMHQAPLWTAFLRFGLAAAILLTVMAVRRCRGRVAGAHRGAAVRGAGLRRRVRVTLLRAAGAAGGLERWSASRAA